MLTAGERVCRSGCVHEGTVCLRAGVGGGERVHVESTSREGAEGCWVGGVGG